MKKNNTLALVEAALMIAMSTVLGMLKIYELPNGGSITCASMVPLVLLSYRRGIKWGLAAAFTESLLQMLLKFNVPPTKMCIRDSCTERIGAGVKHIQHAAALYKNRRLPLTDNQLRSHGQGFAGVFINNPVSAF